MKHIFLGIFFSTFLVQIACSQTTVEFILSDAPIGEDANFGIRGNTYPLSWEKSYPLIMNGDIYSVEIVFEEGITDIEFKFVQFVDDTNPTWETTNNRTELINSSHNIRSLHRWNIEQVVDIKKLPLISVEQLMDDYILIEQMVLEVHPGTYRYNDASSISAGLEELKTTFQEPLTHGQAYLAMSKMTALIQCDHTKPGFNNQNKIINSVIHGQSDKLPFTFIWADDRMIVIYDASSENKLKRGTEILSINGHSVVQIKEEIMPYIAADGASDANRVVKMQVDGYDFRYNAFDVFFPLLFPFQNNEIELELIEPGSESSEIRQILTLTRDERSAILAKRYPEYPASRDEMWSFEVLEGNVGLLTINSFGLMGWKAMTIDYKAFLKNVFDEIQQKEIDDLIIDIRKNNGGNDEMSVELFSYLDIKEPISREIYREGRTRYKQFPEPLKSNVQTWGDNPWYFDFGNPEKDREYYIFKQEPSDQKFIKKDEVFTGNTYLLTSSANTSLAYYTALNFKRHGLGTSVGQETGGNLRGINGGQILFLRLPNSGIEIDFSIMGGFVYGNQPNGGVVPDVVIKPSINQIINNVDVELDTILNELIEN